MSACSHFGLLVHLIHLVMGCLMFTLFVTQFTVSVTHPNEDLLHKEPFRTFLFMLASCVVFWFVVHVFGLCCINIWFKPQQLSFASSTVCFNQTKGVNCKHTQKVAHMICAIQVIEYWVLNRCPNHKKAGGSVSPLLVMLKGSFTQKLLTLKWLQTLILSLLLLNTKEDFLNKDENL